MCHHLGKIYRFNENSAFKPNIDETLSLIEMQNKQGEYKGNIKAFLDKVQAGEIDITGNIEG